MSIQHNAQGNLFSLDGVMGDKLENALRNHNQVRLILSRGANVTGFIKNFDRQYAQAVIETENGECVIRLGYLIQIFVKDNGVPIQIQNGQPQNDMPKTEPQEEKIENSDDSPVSSIVTPETYTLDLQAYIKEHNYQGLTTRQLAEIIKLEKFNDTLKHVWLKEIGQFSPKGNANTQSSLNGNVCKNCYKSIPDRTTFCSKECVEQFKIEAGKK